VKTLTVEQPVLIDETGVKENMRREYGKAPIGERAVGTKPLGGGKNVTVVGALTAAGLETGLVIEGALNGELFLLFVQKFLIPILHPGQVVIMDNLKAHYVDGVEESIQKAGATVLYLPLYSPDLNPIEEGWSKFKNFLRKRLQEGIGLLQAIAEAFDIFSPQDILGWFHHAGLCTDSK